MYNHSKKYEKELKEAIAYMIENNMSENEIRDIFLYCLAETLLDEKYKNIIENKKLN